jgi:phage gp29-like protein
MTQWDRRAEAAVATNLPVATVAAMERDPMVQTALTVKRLGVLASPGRVVPDSDSAESRRRAEFVEETFAKMEGSPATLLDAAMQAFGHGWSVQEAVYRQEGGRIWLQAMRPKDPSWFGLEFTPYGAIEGLRLQVPGEAPRRLPRTKFVVYVYRGGFGRPRGQSDLEAAQAHVTAKNELLKAWKLHLERFASPTMLGAFEGNVSAADRQAVLNALNEMARVNAIVHPREISVSKVGGDREASSGYIDAIEFHNREIARSILGQTLTTDEGRRVGSLALGKVHLQVFLLQLAALRQELADRVMTEQVIRPLIDLNFGPGPMPRYEFEGTRVEIFQ